MVISGEKNKQIKEHWQARIEITQLPGMPTRLDSSHTNLENAKYIFNWLRNPFLDDTVYGLELVLDQNFRWIFYLSEEAEQDAYIKGNTHLIYLENEFPGLSGNLSIKKLEPLREQQLYWLFELKFPNKIDLSSPPRYTIPILSRIITLFHKNSGHIIHFYIMWRKVQDRSFIYPFDIKFYILIEPNALLLRKKAEYYRLLGHLNYFCLDLKNIRDETTELVKLPLSYLDKIMRLEMYSSFTVKSYSFYRENFDFYFLPEIPISKAKLLKNENVDFTLNSQDREDMILLGNYVKNGVPSFNKKYVSKDHFAHGTLIVGQPGTGKTRFLGHICKEFYKKAPDIGILIINLGKGEQDHLYHVDRVIKYGEESCWVPYFVEGGHLEKCLQETADYLVASLGLDEPVNKIMLKVMKAYIEKHGSVPQSVSLLFKSLKKWFLEHKYHNEYQTNILRAIENRVLSLLSDPLVEKTVDLSNKRFIPQWYNEWINGNKIFLDLSAANIYIKRLISNAIFQLVRTLTPEQEAVKLQQLIMIDEAHQILEKLLNRYASSDDHISRSQLEQIFKQLLIEFRSKGLAFIIADQSPSDLFECTIKIPSLKFIFRVGNKGVQCFTNNFEEQEYIRFLKNRLMLVINGVNGEKYTLKTIDYESAMLEYTGPSYLEYKK
ncbi:MAG TPA: hypothetical protein VFG01_09515 [Acidobacteriota bacterium]|nr:hypothetical protein [Acidobacteriota bacterium]